MGFSFSYKKKRRDTFRRKIEENIKIMANRTNKTIIAQCIEILKQAKTQDLFCLKNHHVCYIFNNQVLVWGEEYFKAFLLECFCSLQEVFLFEKLEPDSALYREHIDRAEQKEFLWKYSNKGIIIHKFLSFDKDGVVYVNDKILDDSFTLRDRNKPYFVVENTRRPFIAGVSVFQKLQTLNLEEKKKLYIDLFQYIFDTYTLPSGLLDPKLYDCHTANFVLDTQGNFHFVDSDYLAPQPIKKKDAIDCLFHDQIGSPCHLSVLKHFGFKDLPKPSKPKEETPELKMRQKFFA